MNEDIKLIKRIKRNQDKDSAEKLINKYYDEIYRYAYRQCGQKEDALDITQEIFIAVLKAVYSYDHRKAAFRTYLYRIATNKIIDSRRKINPEYIQYEDINIIFIKENEIDITEDILNNNLLSAIEEYVRNFDTVTQQIYRLHIYAGYTFDEIAKIQNLSEGTVKSKYYRLMKKIKEEFEDEYNNAKR